MKVLIGGASGATGKHLVKHLLNAGHTVKAVVRNPAALMDKVGEHKNLEIIQGTVLDMSEAELAALVQNCDAMASCLGHNVSFKGLFGKPRRLVRDSLKRLCEALGPEQKTRFVLMNSSGVRNQDLNEKARVPHRLIVFLLRHLLPPHADNEQAAEYLRTTIGRNHPRIEWVSVRPDGLIDADEVTGYENTPSPVRDPIFSAGKVSRINVAHFMARLIMDDKLFAEWRGQMPLVYNKDQGTP